MSDALAPHMEKFIVVLLRHRGLAAAGILLSLAASLYAARTIEFRFQYRDFYNYPGNPALPAFERDNHLFGDPAGYVVATVEAPDVFKVPVLQYVARLSDALAPLEVFSRVRSLSTANAIRGDGNEVLTGRLMREIPKTPEELATLRNYVLSNPLFLHRLVSPDGTMTAVLGDMRSLPLFSSVEEEEAALSAFAKVLAANPPPAGVRVRLTGSPAVEVETTRAILRDQFLLVPLVCAALGLMLFATFRTMQGVLLCMASVSVATIWTAGIFALLGRPVDMMGSVIPTTLLVYGVVDPIFVLARYLNKTDAGMSKYDAIVSTLKDLALPCFLTSATTGIGFAAFVTCVAPSIRYYGLTVGIGVMLSFVTTCTVLPLLLSMTPVPKKRFAGAGFTRFVDKVFFGVGKWLEARTYTMIVVAVALLAGAAYAAREQHIDNQYVGSLPDGHAREDVKVLEDKLAGVVRMIVLLEGEEGAMKRPEVLRAIEKVDHILERESGVTYSGSLADIVAEAHMAFMGGQVADRHVPESRALVSQYLTLIDPRDRAEYVTDSYAQSHIALLLKDNGSEDAVRMTKRLREVVSAANFDALGIKATVTGQAVVAYRELDKAVIELLWGFVTAFLIVIALEWLLFRSLRLALLTVIPNLVPVAACFLVTRYAGIALRIDTILVLCISIGGLFNTTIHFIARTIQQVAQGARDRDQILLSSLRTIGPPSLFTAGILSGGFALFVFSSFPGLQALGLLSMVTLITGFVSDVIFTPSLVRVGANWRKHFGSEGASDAREPAVPTIEPA